ncbi:hypothetical protein Efla_004516 [Eimeria flavescens]
MQPTGAVPAVAAHRTGNTLDNHESSRESSLSQHPRRHQWIVRRSTIFLKLAVAVALYFIAAGMLVYICTGSRSNVIKPGLQHRALAAGGGEGEDSEDEALDSILSECLAMAEESGTVLAPFAPPAEDAEEAARRKASLEQYLRTDSPGIEAPQPSQQPTSHFPSSLDELLPYPQTGSMAVLTPWGDSMDDATLQSLLSPDAWMDQILPVVQEQASLLSPDARMDQILPVVQEQAVAGPAGEAEEAGPAHLPPSAEFPAIRAALHFRPQRAEFPAIRAALHFRPQRAEFPAISAALHSSPQQFVRPPSPPAARPLERLESGGAPQPPSTPAITLAELPPPQPYDPALHPYVRLPEVDPRLIPRAFSPQAPLDPQYRSICPALPLLTIRRLLLKPSLDSEELQVLLNAAESLVNIYRRVRTPLQRGMNFPVKLVRRLSVDVLVLDALVSIRYILREKLRMEEWWPSFAQLFETEVRFSLRNRRRAQANLERLNILKDAIKVYKTGVRPSHQQIIKVKRMIFDPDSPEHLFTRHTYDVWREDDENHEDGQDDGNHEDS